MLKHALFAAVLLCSVPASAEDVKPVHALALHGNPKYSSDFKNFDYVNPDAPKGGTLHQYALGTFDSLNPFIVKGNPAPMPIYQSLMSGTLDEAFTEYGDLAASVEMPEDRSWVIFNLRPEAKWNDGVALTADDVVWTFNTLIKEGRPMYRAYYADVTKAEALSPTRVKFTFKVSNNRELPLIMGQMTVLPKHYWTAAGHNFSDTTLTPPVGSGPYQVGEIKAGQSIQFDRVQNWWGKDLPINKGRFNFDHLVYEYYRDANVAFEAFIGGRYDVRQENIAKIWATGYDVPAVKSGQIKKEEIQNQVPQGFQGFGYNTRRPVFKDRAVREALAYAFDFEWSNKQFAYGSYTRDRSYFANSEMEAKGLPDAAQLKILEPFRGQIPDEVFTKEYQPPKTDGSGDLRANLKHAADILDAAGYKLGPDSVRVGKDGQALKFEILLEQDAFERWLAPMVQNLKKIGVIATIRTIDASQLKNRTDHFDYDMIIVRQGQSNSPGNEQRDFFGSDTVDQPGTLNVMGVRSPAVDAIIRNIVMAKTRDELVENCRALDRVLQWGFYMIPNWYMSPWRVAYWDKFGRPSTTPPYGLPVDDAWWAKQK